MRTKKVKKEGKKKKETISQIKGNPIKEKKSKRKKGKKNKAPKNIQIIEDCDQNRIRLGRCEVDLELDSPEVVNLDEDEEYAQLPKVAKKIAKEVKKKVKKIPKIRRAATTENVEDNYMIVPWQSSEEWKAVCAQLHCRLYPEVISKIAVWQRRVQNLPVGVEATLFLLEALVYDQKLLRNTSSNDNGSLYTEDQSRALYSLAIIRYLNHVNHLAAQSLGEASSRPAQELAAIMDTPDWLVTLRNDVSHGPKAPSLEMLRVGGNFVLEWLKEKYWKLPGDNEATDANDPFTILGQSDEIDIPHEISRLLQAYVAARIYKRRHQTVITDPEIVRLTTSTSEEFVPIKTKAAVISLKSSLRSYLLSSPSVFCINVSQELIPSVEFYDDFTSMFHKKSKENTTEGSHRQLFEQLYAVWMPIIKMLESKGKLLTVLSNLCEVMIDPDSEKMWMITARWIDKILEIIEVSGKKYSKHLVGLLGAMIKSPNNYMKLFLERLFRLAEPRIGSEAVHKLELLVNIWLEGQVETRKRKKSFTSKLFSLNEIEGQNGSSKMEDTTMSNIPWKEDRRGEEFWRTIPLGSSL